MLPSLWTMLQLWITSELPDHFQHFQNPQSPWNAPEILRQEYKVGTMHELKPMSKPLSVPVE